MLESTNISFQNLGNFQLKLSNQFKSLADDWMKLDGTDVISSDAYLSLLEKEITTDVFPFYAVVYKNGVPKFGLIYQLKRITLTSSIRDDGDNIVLKYLKKIAKATLEVCTSIYTLTCGNLFITGQYSILGDTIPTDQKLKIITYATEKVASLIEKDRRINVGIHLFKDFYDAFDPEALKEVGLNQFTVQPNMLMDINYPSVDAYIGAMKSKYRVRYRKAIKDCKDITYKELELQDLKDFQEDISRLYRSVSDNAGFNLFVLSDDYFYKLKAHLKDKCQVIGMFDRDDKLRAFYSLIINESELEAHFLGYDQEFNKRYQLYQNMLYQLVNKAIELELSSINFSRTALEIKSTVGAYPKDMFLYIKHHRKWVNKLLPRLIRYFMPPYEYEARSPFKTIS
jgi:hypothetical protein